MSIETTNSDIESAQIRSYDSITSFNSYFLKSLFHSTLNYMINRINELISYSESLSQYNYQETTILNIIILVIPLTTRTMANQTDKNEDVHVKPFSEVIDLYESTAAKNSGVNRQMASLSWAFEMVMGLSSPVLRSSS